MIFSENRYPLFGIMLYAASFTYSKSPGLLSMPTRGGAIQLANLPGSTTCFIMLWMKSPYCVDGSHLSCCAFLLVAATIWPFRDALMSFNWRVCLWWVASVS